MATLIPALSTCKTRMTSGEKRLAERLEDKLDDDYLLWYDVPIGPKNLHPDFVVMHPRRGILTLEVKDWSPKTIHTADKQSWQVFMNGQLTSRPNPVEQARHYARAVADALKRDPQLVHGEGKYQGSLNFPLELRRCVPQHNAQAIHGRAARPADQTAPSDVRRRNAGESRPRKNCKAACGTCSPT